MAAWQHDVGATPRDGTHAALSGVPSALNPFRHPVLLIHTGKTGGSTLDGVLKRARLPFDHVHVHPVPHALVANHPLIVVSVRDPVSRFVSAWEFVRREAGTHVDAAIARFGTGRSSLFPIDVYACFSSVAAFADGLDAPGTCGDLARSLTQPLPPVGHLSHLTMGYCYHLGGVLDVLGSRRRRHWVVRQEALRVDALGMLKWLNQTNPHAAAPRCQKCNSVLPRTHADSAAARLPEASSASTYNLSSSALARLRRALLPEYWAYNRIIDASENANAPRGDTQRIGTDIAHEP